ncbi:hypothetical protein BGW38_004028, partial [Lunasporangiospora selenospora]
MKKVTVSLAKWLTFTPSAQASPSSARTCPSTDMILFPYIPPPPDTTVHTEWSSSITLNQKGYPVPTLPTLQTIPNSAIAVQQQTESCHGATLGVSGSVLPTFIPGRAENCGPNSITKVCTTPKRMAGTKEDATTVTPNYPLVPMILSISPSRSDSPSPTVSSSPSSITGTNDTLSTLGTSGVLPTIGLRKDVWFKSKKSSERQGAQGYTLLNTLASASAPDVRTTPPSQSPQSSNSGVTNKAKTNESHGKAPIPATKPFAQESRPGYRRNHSLPAFLSSVASRDDNPRTHSSWSPKSSLGALKKRIEHSLMQATTKVTGISSSKPRPGVPTPFMPSIVKSKESSPPEKAAAPFPELPPPFIPAVARAQEEARRANISPGDMSLEFAEAEDEDEWSEMRGLLHNNGSLDKQRQRGREEDSSKTPSSGRERAPKHSSWTRNKRHGTVGLLSDNNHRMRSSLVEEEEGDDDKDDEEKEMRERDKRRIVKGPSYRHLLKIVEILSGAVEDLSRKMALMMELKGAIQRQNEPPNQEGATATCVNNITASTSSGFAPLRQKAEFSKAELAKESTPEIIHAASKAFSSVTLSSPETLPKFLDNPSPTPSTRPPGAKRHDRAKSRIYALAIDIKQDMESCRSTIQALMSPRMLADRLCLAVETDRKGHTFGYDMGMDRRATGILFGACWPSDGSGESMRGRGYCEEDIENTLDLIREFNMLSGPLEMPHATRSSRILLADDIECERVLGCHPTPSSSSSSLGTSPDSRRSVIASSPASSWNTSASSEMAEPVNRRGVEGKCLQEALPADKAMRSKSIEQQCTPPADIRHGTTAEIRVFPNEKTELEADSCEREKEETSAEPLTTVDVFAPLEGPPLDSVQPEYVEKEIQGPTLGQPSILLTITTLDRCSSTEIAMVANQPRSQAGHFDPVPFPPLSRTRSLLQEGLLGHGGDLVRCLSLLDSRLSSLEQDLPQFLKRSLEQDTILVQLEEQLWHHQSHVQTAAAIAAVAAHENMSKEKLARFEEKEKVSTHPREMMVQCVEDPESRTELNAGHTVCSRCPGARTTTATVITKKMIVGGSEVESQTRSRSHQLNLELKQLA